MTALVAALLAVLQQLAAASGMTLAVDVESIDAGARRDAAPVRLHADMPMPMASTFKLPLAVAVLRASEKGELPGLDGKVTLLPVDMLPHHSPLYERLGAKGGTVTLREALVPLLEQSDNSAADGLLRIAGGGAKVTAALRAMGVDGISIDRGEAQIGRDMDAPGGVAKFQRDPRDRATPAAMARLVARLWRGELLSPAATAFMQEHMTKCATGMARLRAGLPAAAGAAVADRTGTCGAELCANDVGVVTLPSGERVAIAAFVGGKGATAVKERLIADVARAVWAEYVGGR